MHIAVVSLDIIALGAVLGAAAHLLPFIAAGLGAVWYGFVIYDRIKYGPELERRMLWQYRKKRSRPRRVAKDSHV